jgi:hypothetical protein
MGPKWASSASMSTVIVPNRPMLSHVRRLGVELRQRGAGSRWSQPAGFRSRFGRPLARLCCPFVVVDQSSQEPSGLDPLVGRVDSG